MLELLAELFERLLLLDLVHDEEPVHLVLDLVLVHAQLVQLQLRLLVPRLLKPILTPNQLHRMQH